MIPEPNPLQTVTEALCQKESYEKLWHHGNHEVPMPSVETLSVIMELLRSVLFPGYFGHSEIRPDTMHYYIGSILDKVLRLLAEQVKRGFCFACTDTDGIKKEICEKRGHLVTAEFLKTLPDIRHLLSTDVKAAFEGDPAARNASETIFCYPSIKALTNFRIAHELYQLQIPLIPRIMTEMAHSDTGIDIHPGATIGESFFMDHGTGIVIGETTIIGRNVRVYQGVTLGAKSFPLDFSGAPIKGIPRHPRVEDDVIIYAGATLLGRITIGQGAVIGGNVWVTSDIPAGTRVLQSKPQETYYNDGLGI